MRVTPSRLADLTNSVGMTENRVAIIGVDNPP